jgi:hypothetical protein
MRGSRAVPGLMPILIITLIGCESQSPVGPTAGDRVTVRIEGPDVIDGGGRYSWLAIAHGAEAGEALEYVWDVDWLDTDEPSLQVTGQELVLDVERPRDFELRVQVLRAGRVVASASLGSSCDTDLIIDDDAIDACYNAN